MRLIDADALIKDIDYSADLGGQLGKVVECVKLYAKYMAQTAPTIEPMQWIPVTERLPRDDEPFYVLCCDDRGEQMIGNPFESDDSDTGYSAESEECYMYNVVAWMPLPAPYKGGDADGNM